MSDPMTNAEVEDVLSSIRRLVSDEKPAEKTPEENAAPDRLVLTPALRVSDAEPAGSDSDQQAHGISEAETSSLSDFISEHLGDTAREEPEQDADWVDEVDGHQGEEVGAETHEDAEQDHDGAELTDNWARFGDDVQDDVAQYQPDAPADFPVADDGQTAIQDDTPMPDVDEPSPSEKDHDDVGLSEKVAALEALVASRVDEWEPDDPGTDAYAGTDAPAMEWEDAETPETATFAHHASPASDDVEADEQTIDTQVFASDEDVLDEDTLRDLVTDIVREELQGALGERITRNVRKLVRREIHRALAAQELD